MTAILLAVALFVSGWFTGHEKSTVTVDCRNEPLIKTECVDIYPPEDNTFGATTSSYISLVGQYRKCKQACQGK